jgi:proteasome accessory factor B
MVDKKAERLINLTIALLAANRYLKKSEIFKSVEGYSGTADSMDRMFERDKNELRSLGIDISVGDIDPLFDDEPGYRIFKDSYGFQLKDLEPADVALLSVAAKLWNDSVLGADAQSSLIKLESLGLTETQDSTLTFSYRYENPTLNLGKIEEAILTTKSIKFNYRDSDLIREVEPYRIALWRGFWYVIGKDIDKNDVRIFKVSRISGEVSITKKDFKPPREFNVSEQLPSGDNYEVILKVANDKSVVLRNLGEEIGTEGDEDLVRIYFSDHGEALRELLRHGNNVKVESPKELKDTYRKTLEVLADV